MKNDSDNIRVDDSVDASDELHNLQSVSPENENETVMSQLTLQGESFGENQVERNTIARSSPSLVHADSFSAAEKDESWLYLEEQVSNQVWREIEGKEFSEPVFKTNVVLDAVRVSTPCDANSESALDQDSFASAVEKSASSEEDEDKATNIEVHDSKDILKSTGDDNSNAKDDESFSTPEVSTTYLPCRDGVEVQDLQKESHDSERDIQGSKTWNSPDLAVEATPNVGAAESFESSLPFTLKCAEETKIRCEQTLASEVCESEDAQTWEEAVTSVGESPSTTPHDYELESQTRLQSPNNDLDSRDSVDDGAGVQPNEMCSDTNKEDTALNNDSASLSCNLSSQDSVEETNLETELNTAQAVTSETISTFPEESNTEFNQREEKPSGAFEVSAESSENFQSTHSEVHHFLGSEDNSSLQQDTEEPVDTRCSSSEGYYTPEDTLDLLVRSDSITEEDSENIRTQNNNPELDCTEIKTDTADLQSEKDVTTPCAEQCDELHTTHDLVKGTETENESKNSQSLEGTQDLTRSQMDILKAVTAAFEEILELHGEDSDTDETKL